MNLTCFSVCTLGFGPVSNALPGAMLRRLVLKTGLKKAGASWVLVAEWATSGDTSGHHEI